MKNKLFFIGMLVLIMVLAFGMVVGCDGGNDSDGSNDNDGSSSSSSGCSVPGRCSRSNGTCFRSSCRAHTTSGGSSCNC